ncbi:hypothetical protein KKH15_03035 [Patescibacteria group bacterium]|nr:hypothetical protein [Patescibacteria group bacterium]MBU1754886.1 hypothetical protein [Patescibacteria group bacterium]
MKKILLAIAIAIGFLALAPAAHAGPKFHKAVTEYLAANGETFKSARHMKKGTTLTKGGFICVIQEGHFVSHCVERELLAKEQEAAARLTAAQESARKAAELAARKIPAPVQEAVPAATRKADQLSFFMHFLPSAEMKIYLFYPLILLVLALAGLLVVAITRKNGRKYNYIGK